jgi:hypothetical protein
VVLLRDGEAEDELLVGAAQDADEAQSAHVVARGWSAPRHEDGSFFRALEGASAAAEFLLWFFYPQSSYALQLTYRSPVPARVRIRAGERERAEAELAAAPGWRTETVAVRAAADDRAQRAPALSRWPGAQGLLMERVQVLDADGRERALFHVGEPLSVHVEAVAEADGTFPLIPAALVFRSDAIIVTRHVGEEVVLELSRGDRVEARLDLGPLLLGNGSYLLTVGLYKELDVNNTLSSEIYDVFDRSFEFSVTGNPPVHDEVFRHPGAWSVIVVGGDRAVAAARAADG